MGKLHACLYVAFGKCQEQPPLQSIPRVVRRLTHGKGRVPICTFAELVALVRKLVF